MKEYFIASQDIPVKIFNNFFKTNNNWKVGNKCDFSYTVSTKKQNYYNMKCMIGFKFKPTHRKYLTNKSDLYHTLNHYSEYITKNIIPPNYDISINDNIDNYIKLFKQYKTLILRPTWGFARAQILVFNDFNKFKDYMITTGTDELKKAHNSPHIKSTSVRYVLSPYIESILFNDKVFNVRVFMIVSKINNIYYGGYVTNIVGHIGKIPYMDGLKNMNTENTDGLIATSDEDIYYNKLKTYFGEDTMKHMMDMIDYIIKTIFTIIKKYNMMENYENNINSYEIFGLDFMLTKDMKVYLIEMNDRTGLIGYTDESYVELVGLLLDLTVNKLYEKKYNINIPDKIKEFYKIL